MKYVFFVKVFFCFLFFLGVVLFLLDDIELGFKRYKLRHRLQAVRVEERKWPRLIQYLYNIVDISFERKETKIVFILVDFSVFFSALVLGRYNFSLFGAVLTAVAIAGLPFLLLVTKMEAGRAKSSLEGISLVSELHRQYRICNCNIYEALEKTALADGDYKLSSKRITSLLIRMRDAGGPIALREAIQRFCFSYGTNWAKNLGQCILVSAEQGLDVGGALEDIAQQLRSAYSLEERSRLLNSEASRMTLLLVPIMYLSCFVIAVRFLGMSVGKFLQNQLLNPLGYRLFLINIGLFTLNVLLLYLLKNGKLDY